MLNANDVPVEFLESIKRHLQITWDDIDTNKKVIEKMVDAEIALNHKLGAEFNYFEPGQARQLYKDYVLYSWNNCLNEFDSAYRSEIYQLRHQAEVANYEKQISAI